MENRFFKNIHIGLQKNPICIYFTYRIAEKSYMYLFYIWDFEAFCIQMIVKFNRKSVYGH